MNTSVFHHVEGVAVIACGLLTTADGAVNVLRAAPRPIGSARRGPRVDPYVWSSAEGGTAVLREPGFRGPELGIQLADVMRRGSVPR